MLNYVGFGTRLGVGPTFDVESFHIKGVGDFIGKRKIKKPEKSNSSVNLRNSNMSNKGHRTAKQINFHKLF